MPAIKQERVLVSCPHCGHQQPEPPAAYSTVCKSCGRHFRPHESSPKPLGREAPKLPTDQRRVVCFDCNSEMAVAANSQSAMCKRCGSYMDLRDYHVAGPLSKNFKTRGALTIEPKGYVYNSEAIVGEAVIKGRFLGKLTATNLILYSTAEIKGTLKAALLTVAAANHFRWKEPLEVGSAEIQGELVADLRAENTVTVKASGRMFGNVMARNLVIEAGAVIVGAAEIGLPRASDAKGS